MKCKHKYSTDKEGGVEDLFCVKVGGPRQDSLYDQLKDLIFVADNIGCYDASDYLRGVVKKIEDKPPSPAQVAECSKCSEKIIQQDMLDKRHNTIDGCTQMTKKEWGDKSIPCPITGRERGH